MHFKKGAFDSVCSIKAYGMQLTSEVSPSWNMLDDLESLILLFSNPYFSIVFHEFDNFDSQYTIDRLKLKPGDENNWEYIAKDIRYLMDYGMGFLTKGNSHFSDKNLVELKYMEKKAISYNVKPV